MMVTAGALRELHRIHRQLSDLRERLDRGPKQVRARQGNVNNLQAQWSKAKEDAKAARMSVDRKQLDLKSGENKISDLRTKLNACSTNKEYQTLLDQIAAAEMANSVLSDEIIEGLEGVDTLEKTIAGADKLLGTGKEDLAKIEQKVTRELESIKTDIARLEAELKQAERALPADFRTDYDRIVRAKGEDAMAQVEGDCCGGCYQQITANMQNDLYMGRAVFCKSCGRLMYLPEDRQPVARR